MRGMRKDWYRPYISEIMFANGSTTIFPTISINEEVLQKSIKEILPIIEKRFSKPSKSLFVHEPHIELIKNYLKTKFYGIRPNKHLFEYSYGESLHCRHWEIDKINFVTKLRNKNYGKLRKFFKSNYKGLALRGNKSIPEWVTVEQDNNIITI